VIKVDSGNQKARQLISDLGGIMPEELTHDAPAEAQAIEREDGEVLLLDDEPLELDDGIDDEEVSESIDLGEVSESIDVLGDAFGDDDVEPIDIDTGGADDGEPLPEIVGEPEPFADIEDEETPHVPVPRLPPSLAPGPPPAAPEPEPEPVREPAPLREPEPARELPPIEDDLEEVEFFISQGLFDEAEAIHDELISSHPTDPRVLDALAALEEGKGSESPPSMAPPPPSRSEVPGLAAGLIEESLAGGEEVDEGGKEAIDKMVSQSRVDVQEEIDETDYSTHYDLGLAYKEMGLNEDAIKEFESSAKDSARAAQSLMMIGMCLVNLDRLDEAIKTYKKGLKLEGVSAADRRGLLYELGVGLQMAGKRRDALKCFKKIHEKDPEFADIASRIRALSASSK
jgi:tetratricopeptide (TPR) repeat protein